MKDITNEHLEKKNADERKNLELIFVKKEAENRAKAEIRLQYMEKLSCAIV